MAIYPGYRRCEVETIMQITGDYDCESFIGFDLVQDFFGAVYTVV